MTGLGSYERRIRKTRGGKSRLSHLRNRDHLGSIFVLNRPPQSHGAVQHWSARTKIRGKVKFTASQQFNPFLFRCIDIPAWRHRHTGIGLGRLDRVSQDLWFLPRNTVKCQERRVQVGRDLERSSKGKQQNWDQKVVYRSENSCDKYLMVTP